MRFTECSGRLIVRSGADGGRLIKREGSLIRRVSRLVTCVSRLVRRVDSLVMREGRSVVREGRSVVRQGLSVGGFVRLVRRNVCTIRRNDRSVRGVSCPTRCMEWLKKNLQNWGRLLAVTEREVMGLGIGNFMQA